jgi:PhoPQ-activated pathogenicity-related protein
MWLEHWMARLAHSAYAGRKQRPARTARRAHGTRIGVEVLENRTLLSAAQTLAPAQLTALDTYVATPDASYHYSLNSTLQGAGYTDYVIDMTSQTWRSSTEVNRTAWQHWLQIIVPSNVTSTTALLQIGAGSNSATPPTAADGLGVQAATALGAITVVLPTVPNEPLTFAGETSPRTEDQIIAYTFNQYLNGGDQNWPLLLPMVKSAVRAMDTAQSFVATQSNGTLQVNDFIVTGASKRGWTTWLTPAVDARVRAIVPYVFDALNLNAQIPHENDTYAGVTQDVIGGFSSALQDYTNFNIFGRFNTPQGQALGQIVDPFTYINRPSYNIPKYLIDSTGDQFFAPDSAQFYFHNLPGQNYLRYIPNTDHGLNGDAVAGALRFEKAVLDGAALPRFSWTLPNLGTIDVTTIDAPVTVKMWQATNPNSRDFRLETFGANWTSSVLTDQGGGLYVAHVNAPATGTTAFMVELTYNVDGLPVTFTTQVSEVPLLTPNVVAVDAGGTFNGNPFAATATATGAAGEAVNGSFVFKYYVGGSAKGTPSSTAPIRAGTYTVVAAFTSADANYNNGQSAPVTFTIAKAVPTVVIQDAGGIADGKPFPATGTATGVNGARVSGAFAFTYYAGSAATGTGSSSAPTNPGVYTVQAFFTSTNPNYTNAQSSPVTFTIVVSNLHLYDGTYDGTYSGTSSTNDHGVITINPVPATPIQSTITNGAIVFTIPGGSGTATVDTKGNISGSITVLIQGTPVTVLLTGRVMSVDASGTTNAGTWSYSATLPSGVVVRGHGTWSTHAAQVATDFDGNYTGSYQGSIVVNNNGTMTTTTVNPTSFTSTISNGVLAATFAKDSGLSPAVGTVDANGNINGTASYLYDGITVTVTFVGTATRSLSGVQATGTWSFTADLGNGEVANGQGTWTSNKVLLFEGAYAGSFSGKIVTDDHGAITVATIPGTALRNNSVQLTIHNGVLSMTVPGIPATGTGTVDANGNVTGTVIYPSRGETVTVSFVGTAVQKTTGSFIMGTWSYTEVYSDGVIEMGSGVWKVQTPRR